jgi:hypothetical protein
MFLTGAFKSKDNDLNVDCHVELNNISFVESEVSPEGEKELEVRDLTHLAFDSMLSAEGGIVFNFSFRTKMNLPRFENIKIKGNFFQSKIQAALSNPEKTAEDFKKMGEEFKAIGKEFKKMFKKEE